MPKTLAIRIALLAGILVVWQVQAARAGEPAITALIRELTDPAALLEDRIEASDLLYHWAGEARAKFPALKDLMNDKDVFVQASAARVVWKIEGKAEIVLPTLLTILKSPDGNEARTIAIKTLGEIGPAAAEAAPLLFPEIFQSKWRRGTTHRVVIEAYARIMPQREKVLIDAFADIDDIVKKVRVREGATHVPYTADLARSQLAAELAKVGPSTVPKLVAALGDKRADFRLCAALTLGQLGPHANKSVPALKSALRDENAEVRIAAALALFRVTERADYALPVFVAALKHDEFRIRSLACDGLAALKEKASLALPDLIQSLGVDKNQSPRTPANIALAAMGQPALAPLLAALKNPNPSVRVHALHALSRIHGDVRSAVVPVSQFLKDEDGVVRIRASEVLANFGPQAAPAWPDLVAVHKDKRIDFYHLCVALRAIGPAACDAFPHLLDVMDKGDSWTWEPGLHACLAIAPDRAADVTAILMKKLDGTEKQTSAAFSTLKKLGPSAKSAVPELKRLLATPRPAQDNEHFHCRVLEVLDHIGPDAQSAEKEVVDMLLGGCDCRWRLAPSVLSKFPMRSETRTRLAAVAKANPALEKSVRIALKTDQMPEGFLAIIKAKYPGARLVEAVREPGWSPKAYVVHLMELDRHLRLHINYDGKISWLNRQIRADDIPQAISQTMRKKFPTATFTGANENLTSYYIPFDLGNVRIARTGKIESYKSSIAASDLPKAVQDALAKRYPGMSIMTANELFEAGSTNYVVDWKEGVFHHFALLDPLGNILKEQAASTAGRYAHPAWTHSASYVVRPHELPADLLTAIQAKYPGGRILSAFAPIGTDTDFEVDMTYKGLPLSFRLTRKGQFDQVRRKE